MSTQKADVNGDSTAAAGTTVVDSADRSRSSVLSPPPFDPECAAMLPAYFANVPSPITPDMIVGMRQLETVPLPTDEELSRNGGFSVEERSVPGPAGAPDISLLICRPTSTAGPVGALYFIHGGGMILGNNRVGILEMLDWAEEFELALVSVEYRLAPEYPHPAPVEDCYAGLTWTVAHADELGIDRDRVVVAGVSGGGGLAAATALLARDRGGPALIGQVLMCPMLDDRNNTVSVNQLAGLDTWDRTSNNTGWTALLGDSRGGPGVSHHAAPARATDLTGLPPAFLDVGSAETFRDEVVAYASSIWAAGGQAELHVWPGGYHGYDLLAPQARISQETRAARVRWLRRVLAS